MEWPKLKNIILIILALTNLCLLGSVAGRELEDDRLQRQALNNAVQFLMDRGVMVTERQIPDEVSLLPQLVERDLEREEALAVQLLGPVQVEAPGGGVYRYFNENGSLQFHSDGVFSGNFQLGAIPVGENREEDCLAILKKLDFEGTLLEAEGGSLTFQQIWDDQPLFSQQVTLNLRDGSLISMTAGRRLAGQPVVDAARRPITAATALIDFLNGIDALGDVCSRVDAIVQGYVSSTSLAGPMALTPVWRVFTDTGAYQLDMVTGVLSRSS